MADAVVRKRQDALVVRTTQQTVRLDILNAITNVADACPADTRPKVVGAEP